MLILKSLTLIWQAPQCTENQDLVPLISNSNLSPFAYQFEDYLVGMHAQIYWWLIFT